MSYEGFEQVLCNKAHYHEFSCYDSPGKNWVCDCLIDGKACGAKVYLRNSVDETNGGGEGYRKPTELTPRISKNCDMGHPHVISDPTYKLGLTKYRRAPLSDDERWIPQESTSE
jgi:hypothetical protein